MSSSFHDVLIALHTTFQKPKVFDVFVAIFMGLAFNDIVNAVISEIIMPLLRRIVGPKRNALTDTGEFNLYTCIALILKAVIVVVVLGVWVYFYGIQEKAAIGPGGVAIVDTAHF